MWVKRFETYLASQVQPGGAIRAVSTFQDAGYTQGPFGIVVELDHGASLYLQIVRASPSGGEGHGKPEQIVEGDAPAPVDVPPVAARNGRVAVVDVEEHLRALLVNGGSREIRQVRSFSRGEGSGGQKYGLAVDFHSGGINYLLFVHTLPPGRRPSPDNEFATLEVI